MVGSYFLPSFSVGANFDVEFCSVFATVIPKNYKFM